MKRALLTLTLAAGLWGQVERPALGLMLDERGVARPVYGLPGSIFAGDPVETGILSSACSGFCLLKTAVAVKMTGGTSTAAPAGPALFAFYQGGAFVYFPWAAELAWWENGQLTPRDAEIAGEILSIRAPNGTVEFAVRRPGGILIVSNGSVIEALPAEAHLVMLLDQTIVYATSDAVVVRRPDASESRFPLELASSLVRLGGSYVQIRAGRSSYGLRVDPGQERLFLLP